MRHPAGVDLLHDPTLNKGTAFTEAEREALKLRGLLPPRILTQEQQVQKILENFRSQQADIDKYLYLISQDPRGFLNTQERRVFNITEWQYGVI